MSNIMKTAAPELISGKGKGIRDIPAVIRRGGRMTKGQLRFSLFVVVFIVMLLIGLILISGSKSTEILTHNEQGKVLDHAIEAERIEAPRIQGTNVLRKTVSRDDTNDEVQYVLTERASEKAGYWLAMCTKEQYQNFLMKLEEAKSVELFDQGDGTYFKFETDLGENRFAVLKEFDNAVLLIAMSTEQDIQYTANLMDGIQFVSLSGEITGDDWLRIGTEEENARYVETFNRMSFFQYKNNNKTVRFIPADEKDESVNTTRTVYRLWSLFISVLMLAVPVFFAVKLLMGIWKSQQSYRMLKLVALAVLLIVYIYEIFSLAMKLNTFNTAETAEDVSNLFRLSRIISILLLFATLCVFAYTLKSAKLLKQPESRKKIIRWIILGLALVLLVGVVLMSVMMNRERDRMIRTSPMILDAEPYVQSEADESEEVRQFISEDPNKQGTFTAVKAYEEQSGLGFQRAVFYSSIVLLVLVLFAAVYFFRYERDLGFSIFNAIILIGLMFVTVYPVLNTVAVSFNEGNDAARGGITLLPRKFSMVNYDEILDDRTINAAWVSASKTVIITILNLFWTGMLAYTLSRKEYVLRKTITTIMVLTMYVNAGLIPNYLLISQTLNLAHTYWVYIIPTMFSCFNMIVIRTYIAGLPDALVESAKIDGAGDFRVYWQIIFPLCTPVLATVALFVAVGSWNSWFDTRLYNANQNDPQTLQYLLQMKILNAASQGQSKAKATADALQNMEQTQSLTVQAAVTVVSTVPILVVYPVLQRYFVTGMALGAVKG